MTGLEKILAQIKGDSDEVVASTLSKAKEEADKILSEAKEQAQAECKKIEQASVQEVAEAKARAKSAMDLQRRKMILAEKQRLISEVIKKAKQSLETLSDEAYFDMIIRMMEKFVGQEQGQILFSEKDLARMPQDFKEKLKSNLTLSSETRNIDGGFVLVYGGVEENCSFTALFDSAQESLQDQVLKLLFS